MLLLFFGTSKDEDILILLFNSLRTTIMIMNIVYHYNVIFILVFALNFFIFFITENYLQKTYHKIQKYLKEETKNEENCQEIEINVVYDANRRNIEFQLGYFVKH